MFLGVLVTALPCRLQNDSPPESINEVHLIKESDTPKILNKVFESKQHLNENNNLLKLPPKLPPDLDCQIDESNYVNLNEISKCKAISNDYNGMRGSIHKTADVIKNGIEKSGANHLNGVENKNVKLNSFYLQINSTSTIANGHSTSKHPIVSIVNQKNLNNIAKNALTNNINSNSTNANANTNCNGAALAVATANQLNNNNNNLNGNNKSNNSDSINCNGVLAANECVIDTKSITANGIDYNKNGLPTVSTAHAQYDVSGGHNQVQYANRNGSLSNGMPQSYVIQNGNGLLTNGNASIKEIPRADNNKGKNGAMACFNVSAFFVLCFHYYA